MAILLLLIGCSEFRVVPFHGDEIVTFESDGSRWVAMRRIVENMGLNWAGQHAKLLEQKSKFNCIDIHTVADDGKPREMLAMPVEKLPLWLASINPAKIKNDVVRVKVERYFAAPRVARADSQNTTVAISRQWMRRAGKSRACARTV